jgi:hypothetical protein
MWAFAFRVEFHRLMPIDRLQHADPSKPQRPAIFCSLGDATRGATASGFNGTACFDCLHNDLIRSAVHSISQTLTKRLAFHSFRFSFRFLQ